MEKYELQKLRDLPIEGVAERLGLQVTRHKCLCPFHDDHHASLSFKVSRNTYRCFVCGAHGGPIDLVMKYLNKDFLDACRWLDPLLTSPWGGSNSLFRPPEGGNGCAKSLPSGRFGGGRDWSFYARFFEHPWLSPEARKFLFDERRLDARVVRWCRLTSWRDKRGVPWLQIPYYDREGKLVGIQNRNLTPLSSHEGDTKASGGLEGVPRFRFPAGSRCGIYNLPVLGRLRPHDELWITEGCSDCWAMLSAGHKAIAIPSATLLKKKDIELLSMLNSPPLSSHEGDTKASPRGGLEEGVGSGGVVFHMYPDNDAPGERLFMQLKEVLPNLVRHQLPPGCKDYSEYYLQRI